MGAIIKALSKVLGTLLKELAQRGSGSMVPSYIRNMILGKASTTASSKAFTKAGKQWATNYSKRVDSLASLSNGVSPKIRAIGPAAKGAGKSTTWMNTMAKYVTDAFSDGGKFVKGVKAVTLFIGADMAYEGVIDLISNDKTIISDPNARPFELKLAKAVRYTSSRLNTSVRWFHDLSEFATFKMLFFVPYQLTTFCQNMSFATKLHSIVYLRRVLSGLIDDLTVSESQAKIIKYQLCVENGLLNSNYDSLEDTLKVNLSVYDDMALQLDMTWASLREDVDDLEGLDKLYSEKLLYLVAGKVPVYIDRSEDGSVDLSDIDSGPDSVERLEAMNNINDLSVYEEAILKETLADGQIV